MNIIKEILLTSCIIVGSIVIFCIPGYFVLPFFIIIWADFYSWCYLFLFIPWILILSSVIVGFNIIEQKWNRNGTERIEQK